MSTNSSIPNCSQFLKLPLKISRCISYYSIFVILEKSLWKFSLLTTQANGPLLVPFWDLPCPSPWWYPLPLHGYGHLPRSCLCSCFDGIPPQQFPKIVRFLRISRSNSSTLNLVFILLSILFGWWHTSWLNIISFQNFEGIAPLSLASSGADWESEILQVLMLMCDMHSQCLIF